MPSARPLALFLRQSLLFFVIFILEAVIGATAQSPTSMAMFYDDLGKPADDLLTKGFPVDGSFKVSAATRTSNGLGIISTGRRYFKGGVEMVEANFEPAFDWSARNVALTGSVSTSADYEAGVAMKDLISKGTRVSLTGRTSPLLGMSLKGGVDFKNDRVAGRVNITYPQNAVASPVLVDTSAVVALQDIRLGSRINFATAHVRGDKETASTTFWNFKAGLMQPLWQSVAWFHMAALSNLVGATFIQEVTPNVRFATSFSVDRLAANAAPVGAVAGDYRYAMDTLLKGRLAVNASKDLRMALALQQNWTANATVTIGADLNALQILGTNKGDPHSFGVEINLK